jgi:peptidoglycan/xylan/chitin deacetylase (PgdA/CDA1 family)
VWPGDAAGQKLADRAKLQMSLLVLIYHRVDETSAARANVHCLSLSQFGAQMDHLRRAGYTVMSWRDLRSEALNGPAQIALTFDDGNRSDLECARLLAGHGFDALFFIATDYLGQPGYLQRDDVAELRRLGMTIGSHGHRHLQLTSLSDVEVTDELTTSRAILEDIVGQPIEHFSFPGGAYDDRVVAMSRRAGYQYLFTSDWGLNRAAQLSARLLRRTSILNHLDSDQFDNVLHQRNYFARQLGFKAKEWMKKRLGQGRYVQIRQVLLDLRKSRQGR